MEPTDLTRRSLLGGLAAGGGVLALAACGSSDDPSAASSAPPTTGTPTDTPTDTATPGDGAASLAAVSDVAVGSGVVVTAEQVVVTQPASGDFHAFSSICTHRGCEVAEVVDNEIACPCHGSRFSATDGSVLNGPATAPLAEVPVRVAGGEVVRA